MTGQSKQHHTRRHGAFVRFMLWRKRNLSEKAFVFLLASLVGLLVGTGAFILSWLVTTVSQLLTSYIHEDSANWALLVIPLTGIILSGFFCRHVIHIRLAHGVRQVMRGFTNRVCRLKGYMILAPIIASSVTLGFGGSAGAGGPIAYTGAAIGRSVARMFRLTPRLMMLMVGCGAAAGIAGIFKSPLGGVLFSLEVQRMQIGTFPVMVLFVAVLIAAMTSYVLSGCAFDIPFDQSEAFYVGQLPYVLLLGLFCGFYSLYYSFVMKKTGILLDRIGNPLGRNLAGGALLAVLVFVFPSLYGEGYGVMGKIVNGDFSSIVDGCLLADSFGDGDTALISVAIGTMLVKCFATSATNNGGGVSGDFSPTLFSGCLTGFFFSSLLNTLFGLGLPETHFAFYAMAGVMAGVIRAPLMAMFLTCEMGAAYSSFLPLMLTAVISFGVVRLFTSDSYFSHRTDRNNGLISRVVKNNKG